MSEIDAGPAAVVAPPTERARAGRRGLGRLLRTQPLGAVAAVVIVAFVVAAALAPFIAPFGPTEQHRDAFLALPGSPYLMGTDDLGRDIFSRVLYGARTSLLVAVCTLVAGGVIGMAIGVVSGYFAGGWVDTLLQRIMDTLMAIPGIVLLLFIAALLGPSIRNTVIALSLLVIPTFNRVSRGEMLRIREELYVESARASGCSTWRILRRHGLPNLLAPLLVVASLTFAIIIIAESALSFLGIGTPPPTPSWGAMLSDGSRYMEIAPWMVVFPGGALTLGVLAFNLLGDAMRDFFDPKQSGR
jgi:ABC-type dipeptide/oligopeptide/nickel transport system permease subunit